MGRPTKYDSHVKPKLNLVVGWAREGLIDEQIAKNLGISVASYYDYKLKYLEFMEALKKGKEVCDFEVEGSLFKRANGYTYDETTQESRLIDTIDGKSVYGLVTTKKVTKQVAPDPVSMIFWLKNRKPALWRDRKDIDIGSGNTVTIVKNDLETDE